MNLHFCHFQVITSFVIFNYRYPDLGPSLFAQSFAGRHVPEFSPNGGFYDDFRTNSRNGHHVQKRGGSMGSGGVYPIGNVQLLFHFMTVLYTKLKSAKNGQFGEFTSTCALDIAKIIIGGYLLQMARWFVTIIAIIFMVFHRFFRPRKSTFAVSSFGSFNRSDQKCGNQNG